MQLVSTFLSWQCNAMQYTIAIMERNERNAKSENVNLEIRHRIHILSREIVSCQKVNNEQSYYCPTTGAGVVCVSKKRLGETRSTSFLTQRISIAIQRGNWECRKCFRDYPFIVKATWNILFDIIRFSWIITYAILFRCCTICYNK